KAESDCKQLSQEISVAMRANWCCLGGPKAADLNNSSSQVRSFTLSRALTSRSRGTKSGKMPVALTFVCTTFATSLRRLQSGRGTLLRRLGKRLAIVAQQRHDGTRTLW